MYYAPSGDSNRRIEPYYLVFRWSSWYVWGWCLDREDYRLFKLNRMDCVVETDRGFLRRDVPMPDLSNEKIFPGGIKVKALFTPDVKWRLVEEFERTALQKQTMEGCSFQQTIRIWKTL